MKISLAGWSLQRRFRRAEDPLTLLEFPGVAREEFDIEAIELNSPFFASTEPDYLEALKTEAGKFRVGFVGLAVDGTGDPASLDEEARQDAVERIRAWFPVARALGLSYFRANTGGRGAEEDPRALEQCVRSFRELAQAGARHAMTITIENHGGLSACPDRVVAIMEAVGSPWIGTLPDFGNFPEAVRYEGLRKLAPYARGMHAKTFEFDEWGEERRFDLPRCVRTVREGGYDGYFGIEYEGPGDDHEGVLKSKALLARHLGAA
jgi:sugar phosphate isomerase/epimerase